ncbi:uncharacterized protein KQ657_004235 [Scheffersomyces spartinae]|uniref:EamA domain-containing protein n=1 Tax=Scheffersomyces spartinae TaxID=45513 RepID=A0A9P8AJ74_9ASCO|nr:uncharacterized protein KQ657_004235 [Scheffersomyces spartinae]KAG7194564.1 hypothetical protein KQ657_004235 [Scheffersomyces spartinae]
MISMDKILRYAKAFILPENELSPNEKWILGLINLLSVVLFWVASSFLVNALVEEDTYKKPFFITYINTGCFCLYLIPYLQHKDLSVSRFIRQLKRDYQKTLNKKRLYSIIDCMNDDEERNIGGGETPSPPDGIIVNQKVAYLTQANDNYSNHSSPLILSPVASGATTPTDEAITSCSYGTIASHEHENEEPSRRLRQLSVIEETMSLPSSDEQDPSSVHQSHELLSISKSIDPLEEDMDINIYETVLLSLQFVILWFLANLATNASLSYTTVASQTILSSTSSFFTLLIGFIYSVEKINANKVTGIVLSFIGVVIVTKIDTSGSTGNSPETPTKQASLILLGNVLALGGALIYGVYTILLKVRITIPHLKKERNLNTHLFFGFVGIFCLVLLWPALFILHWLQWETFELPSTRETITLLCINATITFISDLCWCKAVLLTSPLTVTVGLSMTIPLAMVGDWIIKRVAVNIWYLFGAIIVTLGFLIINQDEQHDFVDAHIIELPQNT